MPSMNATRLFTAVSADGTDSNRLQIQAVRDESITFWCWFATVTGGSIQLRGAPDNAADILTTPGGMVFHTIITTGTAGANQTKVNAQGHALVVLQAVPVMWARFIKGIGTDSASLWLIE